MTITPPFLNGFAPYLILTPRIRSLDNIYRQNSYPRKAKIAVAAILKITFLVIARPLLHIFTLNAIYRGRKRGLGDRVAMKLQMYPNPRWRW